MADIQVDVQVEPSTPGAGEQIVYVDSADNHVKTKDDTGLVTDLHGVGSSALPQWVKYTVTHTQLQVAALSGSIELFSAAAKAIVHEVAIKHTIAFAGAAITAYSISVGIAGDVERHLSLFDVLQAVAESAKNNSVAKDFLNFGSVTSIRVNAESIGANLDQSTSGSVEIWVLCSVLP